MAWFSGCLCYLCVTCNLSKKRDVLYEFKLKKQFYENITVIRNPFYYQS